MYLVQACFQAGVDVLLIAATSFVKMGLQSALGSFAFTLCSGPFLWLLHV